MHEGTPDFSDLDDTTLDQASVADQPKSFLEFSAQLAGRKSVQDQTKCYACKGTGKFYSNRSGRLVGECFSCKGTGKVTARAAKSHATKQANAARNAQSAIDRKNAFIEANKDVIGWIYDRLPRSNFAGSLVKQYEDRGTLSENQIAAVRKIISDDAERARIAAERQANTNPVNQSGLDLSGIPAGRYAVPGGDTRLKVLIKRPTPPSRWAGYTFVSDAAEYGQRTKYGMQAPGYRYRGKIEAELTLIAKDPKAAAVAYGRLTGTCCICGRKLEDEASVAAGIGPICAGRF